MMDVGTRKPPARGAGAPPQNPSAALALARPAPVLLASGAARREAVRPPAHRGAGFDAKFDAETLFYDAFLDTDRRIVLLGPPFLNLKPAIERMTVTAWPSGASCRFQVVEWDRHGQVRVDAPDGTARLTLASAAGLFEVAVQPSEVDVFAGLRVLFTLSRNNDLVWIQDWIRFARDVHGAQAVLFYDNASTRYALDELAAAVGAVDGLAAARIVSWPFKYGPQGLDAARFWDSDFCQHGAWEHARRRFLAAAASAQNADVDELVVSPEGESVFAAAESDRFGMVRYHGRWVIGIDDGAAGPEGRRHRDYGIVRRERPVRRFGVLPVDADRCPPKWTLVPARCPPDAQWRVHTIGGYWPARRTTGRFSYRHFRELTDNWKYERSGREAFDPARHEADPVLKRSLSAVRWDV